MIAFRMERSNYDIVPKKVPSGKPTYIAMENGPVEIVDLPLVVLTTYPLVYQQKSMENHLC
jgi:hypothetical protein